MTISSISKRTIRCLARASVSTAFQTRGRSWDRRNRAFAIDLRPRLELGVQPGEATLESGDVLKRGVPSGLQLPRDMPLGGVHVVVAAFGP